MALLLNKQDKEEFEKNYSIMLMGELCKHYNCSPRTIQETVRACKIGKNKRHYHIKWTDEIDEFILYGLGTNIEKANKLNISLSSVNNRKRELKDLAESQSAELDVSTSSIKNRLRVLRNNN